MSRPNFFCNTNTLKYLAQMEYADDHEAIDISVDCIELPFWLLFSSDEENYYLKLIKRYEIFWHDENMSVIISELTANKTTGEASLKTYDTGDEFLSMINPGSFRAFFATCKNLSFYAQKNSMDTKFGDINPDEAGIMLTVDGDELTYKLVRGKERPEMMCFNMDLLDNGIHMARPYQNEIIERHAKGLLPLESKIAAAESGDPVCMEFLAQAYLNGNDDDVKQDFKKAAYWWEKLADTGNAIGQFNFGLLYAKGCGVKRDFAKAAEWMNKAAANGDADASGVAKLYAETAEILKKAEAGDVSAQAAISKIYTQISGSFEQFGPDRDYAESFKWAKKAAGNGSLDGMYYLGLCYEHARGTDYDPAKAAMIYQKAAELGHAPSQWNLAVCYFNGQGCERNETKGLYWAYESADKGHDFAIQGLERMGKTLPQIIEYLSDNETEIKLDGTQYEGRADRCERIISGMELTYKIINDKNGDDAIECFYNGGTVGLISKWVAEDLIALLKMDRITLTIKVKSCIPKSKRGARARNAEVHLKLIIKEKASKKAAKSMPKSAPEKPAAEAEKEKRKPAEKVQLTEEEKKAIKEEKAKQAEKTRQKRIVQQEEKARQEEEAKREEEARKQEAKAKYEADMSAWRTSCAAVKAQREEKEKELLQAEKEQIEAAAKAKYDASMALNQGIIDKQTKRKSDAEQFLATLSFFRFIEKNNQRSIIEDAEKKLADAKSAVAIAESEYKSSMESAASIAQKKAIAFQFAVERKLPLPVEPTMPYFMRQSQSMPDRQKPRQMETEELKRAVYNVLASGKAYTITKIIEEIPESEGLSHSRLNQIVLQMKNDGVIVREERERKAYFRLA